MALIKCPECSNEISTKAKSCPKCGWKASKTRWWLWLIPFAIAIFLALPYLGSLEPEYEKVARENKDLCKRIGLKSKDECDEAYEQAIAIGERRKR